MSAMKNYLEGIVYSMEYKELYILLKSKGWTDEEIKDLYDVYH